MFVKYIFRQIFNEIPSWIKCIYRSRGKGTERTDSWEKQRHSDNIRERDKEKKIKRQRETEKWQRQERQGQKGMPLKKDFLDLPEVTNLKTNFIGTIQGRFKQCYAEYIAPYLNI